MKILDLQTGLYKDIEDRRRLIELLVARCLYCLYPVVVVASGTAVVASSVLAAMLATMLAAR